ncbi:MAG: AraC family transcriptional regulator [Bacteroidales bacterium]|nr:AraC family transcriptional regulator [Bacteroidales bacterium]
MTTAVGKVKYSDGFDADFLLISNPFLHLYNPEQVWATKGYVYIKTHPVFHLEADGWEVVEADFTQFRRRICSKDVLFHEEKVGRLFQLLLMDMWGIYSREMEKMDVDETSARIFMKFLLLVQRNCREQREVAWYADKLFVTPKYLSAICQGVTGKPGSYWIEYYTVHEILLLLNDPGLTLTEIADRMNFPAPPMLTRYLKRAIGQTPSAYRKGKI